MAASRILRERIAQAAEPFSIPSRDKDGAVHVGEATEATHAVQLGQVAALGGGDFLASGAVPMTGHLNMGGFRITNLGAPTAASHAVTRAYADATYADIFLEAEAVRRDGTVAMTGDLDLDGNALLNVGTLDMGGQPIQNVQDPSDPQDAVTLAYYEANLPVDAGGDFLADGSVPMTGDLDLDGNNLLNVARLVGDGGDFYIYDADNTEVIFEAFGDATSNYLFFQFGNTAAVSGSKTAYFIEMNADAGPDEMSLAFTNSTANVEWRMVIADGDGDLALRNQSSGFTPVRVLQAASDALLVLGDETATLRGLLTLRDGTGAAIYGELGGDTTNLYFGPVTGVDRPYRIEMWEDTAQAIWGLYNDEAANGGWEFRIADADGDFAIREGDSGGVPFSIAANTDGDLLMLDGGEVTVDGALAVLGNVGFYGVAAIAQPAAIADPTDAPSTQARLTDLLGAIRDLGLIAT